MTKYVKASVNIVLAALAVLAVIFFVPRLIVFLTPFIVGWVIALIAKPLVHFLETKVKIKRKIGGAFVIVVVIAAIVVGLYFLGVWIFHQLTSMLTDLPRLWKGLEADLANVAEALNLLTAKLPGEETVDFHQIITGFVSSLGDNIETISIPTFNAVGDFAMKLPSIFIGVIMALLSSYFFVADRNLVREWLDKFTPVSWKLRWQMVKRSLSSSVGGYFKAQLKIEVWMYLLLVLGLGLLKVDYFALIALLIALLDFFPVFGTGTVMVPWAITRILIGDLKMAIWLLIIWAAGQLMRQLIQPKIMGDTMGVPTLPTLFLLYIGYKVAGVLGMIISIPLGLLLYALYQEGAFDTTKNSFLILWAGLDSFRTLNREDLAEADELAREKRKIAKRLKEEKRE